MRLSTEPDRDETAAVEVLHAALHAGVTLLDTADAYCRDDSERGHNERLIARALRGWSGDRERIRVATKGGMIRPGGRWEADGRAKHLMAACEASCRALGVDRIDLYQLHAPDPRVPLATSLRALAALKRDGRIAAAGLCNVTVGQIESARKIVEIDAVQVELSVWQHGAILGGVVDYCTQNRIPLLAYRPVGGRRSLARTAADPALTAVAARHGSTPFEVALAWLRDVSSVIVPLPGVTRVETARSSARARDLRLTDEDRATLDARFPAGRSARSGPRTSAPAPQKRDAEVVLVMGLPGAGKSTLARDLVAGGYQRLNRDEQGGTLNDLIPALDRALAGGISRIALDNTYVTRKSRADVIRAAAARGVPVRCVWLTTSLEDAQVNAAWRLVERYGRLPDDDDLRTLRKKDPGAFPPSVQFRYQRELEPPDASEGFSRVDVVPFARRVDPAHVNRALIVWWDDFNDIERRANVLRRYHADGWLVLGLAWRMANADFADLRARLGFDLEVEICPHDAGPPRCWCRKPIPGLGVLFTIRHRLDPSLCVYVGGGAQDPGYARKLGFAFRPAGEFFAS